MQLRPTDLPEPVAPAISRCGIASRREVKTSPLMSLPSASVNLDSEFRNCSESINWRG